MIQLRAITADDIREIKGWPRYGGGFEQMDYALRDSGWLDEFQNRPGASLYAVVTDGAVVGFSLLSVTAEGDAEFRIAVHPDRTGTGIGREVTQATLERGFQRLGLGRIHLIVRQSNPRALRLYERIGFLRTGESIHRIHGKDISFIDMEITRERFYALRIGEDA